MAEASVPTHLSRVIHRKTPLEWFYLLPMNPVLTAPIKEQFGGKKSDLESQFGKVFHTYKITLKEICKLL